VKPFSERVVIFVGAYGSGKTELALNYTLELSKCREKVAIVDLDLVSPYFRSRDIKKRLMARGIEVIAPATEIAVADLPVVTPRIQGALAEPQLQVVIDVGGDPTGATALGRFRDQLISLPHQLLLVINTCRPFTKDVTGIRNMLAAIESSAHLTITGLLANCNLGPETTIEVMMSGLDIVRKAGQECDLPVVGMGVWSELAGQIGTLPVPIWPLDIQLLPPWLSETAT
jgi:hypothetical protein